MKLNTNSWHYKMWYDSFDYHETIPKNTDLCRYCHRVFWRLMVYAFLYLSIAALAFLLVYGAIYQGLWRHTKDTLIFAGVLTAIGIPIVLYVRWFHGERFEPDEPKTLLGKYARAVKQGICPLVEFDRTDRK
jgi:hypothetical protein